MNKTQTIPKEPKLIGDGGRKDLPLLTAGKRPSMAPTRLIAAGDKAMFAAAAADAEVRRSRPPPEAEKNPGEKGREGEQAKREMLGWSLVVGHGV